MANGFSVLTGPIALILANRYSQHVNFALLGHIILLPGQIPIHPALQKPVMLAIIVLGMDK